MKHPRCQITLLLAALICAASITLAQGDATAVSSPAASLSSLPVPPPSPAISQDSGLKIQDAGRKSVHRTPISEPPTPSVNQSSPAATPPPPAATPTAPDDRRLFLADERQEPSASAPSAAGLMVRTLGALLLIIGLIVAAAWALKRMGGARFGSPRENAPELTVLATVALGDRRSIAAVRFGQRTLLLGSTAQGITLLATEEGAPASSAPPLRSVADLLQASEEPPFDQALSSAERHFAYVREAESGAGGQA